MSPAGKSARRGRSPWCAFGATDPTRRTRRSWNARTRPERSSSRTRSSAAASSCASRSATRGRRSRTFSAPGRCSSAARSDLRSLGHPRPVGRPGVARALRPDGRARGCRRRPDDARLAGHAHRAVDRSARRERAGGARPHGRRPRIRRRTLGDAARAHPRSARRARGCDRDARGVEAPRVQARADQRVLRRRRGRLGRHDARAALRRRRALLHGRSAEAGSGDLSPLVRAARRRAGGVPVRRRRRERRARRRRAGRHEGRVHPAPRRRRSRSGPRRAAGSRRSARCRRS